MVKKERKTMMEKKSYIAQKGKVTVFSDEEDETQNISLASFPIT